MTEHEIETYRAAGEFYGRLCSKLSFGFLIFYKDGHAFRFEWEIEMKSERYRCTQRIDINRFIYENGLESLERLALETSEHWKSKARKTLPPEELETEPE